MSNQQTSNLGVSVIGLGAMGSGIARTLIEGGCTVSVWNRSRAKVDALVATGAIACNEPGDALKANTHVIVCVSDYAVWQQIIQEHSLASRFEDTCIIQLTTGTIDDVQTHASLIHDNGGRLIEGAVMCYPRNLGTDEAALLLSGAPDVLDECAHILSALDANWTSLGEDINQPSVLSRSLMSGLTGALMGLVNGAAICRAGGVPLDIFMKFNEGTNSILLAEQKRLGDISGQAATLMQMAKIAEDKGQIKEADHLYSQAIALQRKSPGSLSQDLVKMLERYRDFLLRHGDKRKAMILEKEARSFRGEFIEY